MNIHQQMTQPQLSQSSWRVVLIICLMTKLHTINLITNPKNVLDVAVAMLDSLTDSLHLLVAQLLVICQFNVCNERYKVTSDAYTGVEGREGCGLIRHDNQIKLRLKNNTH